MPAIESATEKLRTQLGEEVCIDLRLPGGGRLYMDRPLPFLCLYREPPGGDPDHPTRRLVTTQASYLAAPAEQHDEIEGVLAELADEMARRFGRFLVMEIWISVDPAEEDEQDPYMLQPEFRVAAPDDDVLHDTVSELSKGLQRVSIHRFIAAVTTSCSACPAPHSCEPIVLHHPGARVVGIELSPVYRERASGEFYPFLFESLRRQLGEALKKGAYAFTRGAAGFDAPGYLALGRRALEQAVYQVDEGLARIDESFEFLLQTTPVNANEARRDFTERGCERDPVFRYRPMPVDPELLKRRLFDLPIERVEDPSLSRLFREKQEELDRKITMLRDRDTRRFFFGSLQLYGEVRLDLLADARALLDALPRQDFHPDALENMDAQAFAEVAALDLRHYREHCPEFPETVHIRHDMPPGLMVSQGRLLIGVETRVPANRVEALLSHEVGTHMLTFFNGRAQPLRLLYNGLAGYEALQEGLAVLSEYLVGGLDVARLRVLAARVIAAHCMIEGSSFVELFRLLRREYDFDESEAFSISMRTFRGGGLVKDVIYLRGLRELMDHLRGGGSLEALLIGKIALHHLPVLEELHQRGVLRPYPLRPRYLLNDRAAGRLQRVQEGVTYVDLIKTHRE